MLLATVPLAYSPQAETTVSDFTTSSDQVSRLFVVLFGLLFQNVHFFFYLAFFLIDFTINLMS